MAKHQVSLGVLLETQVFGRGLEKAICKVSRDIPIVGRSGGIPAFWKRTTIEVKVILGGRQAFVGKITEGAHHHVYVQK